MKSTKEFSDFTSKYSESPSVWISKPSDLRYGSRMAVALLADDNNEATPVVETSSMSESSSYSQSLLVRHLSPIEYVYEFRGQAMPAIVRFETSSRDSFEDSFSCGCCTDRKSVSHDDGAKCFMVQNNAVSAQIDNLEELLVSGEVGVHCILDNGEKIVSLPYEILIPPQ